MNENPYRMYCPFLDEIVDLKVLSPEEEVALSNKIFNRLKRNHLISAPEFRKDICSHVVEGWPVLLQRIIDVVFSTGQSMPEKELIDRYVMDLYYAILAVYNTLDLDMMLSKLNTSRMKEDWSDYLKKVMLGLEEEDDTPSQITTRKKSKPPKMPRTVKDLKKLEDALNRLVIGQAEAVKATVDAIKLMVTGLADFSTLFFVGPTGNGKTRLAKVLSDIYYKDRFFKVNCGEYSSAHEYAKLIGSPPGYIGYTEKSVLTEKAEISNSWIFLFDEIDKAHPKFYDFLLNLMDEGKITDSNGKVLDFSKSIFIFTSNKGMAEGRIGSSRLGFGKEKITYKESKDGIKESIKRSFSPEFLNRIDKIILFNQLNKEELIKVARLELNGIPVKKTKELLNYLIENGYSEEYGGRHLAKYIKNNIAILVANAVLDEVLPKSGNYYTCKIKDNTPYIVEMEK
jgi:ATP-dependent Clp protease ATP-binding subunit ClpA